MDVQVFLYIAAALLIFFAVYLHFSHKTPVQVRDRVEADTCAICLERIAHEAQACCGHVYCGKS